MNLLSVLLLLVPFLPPTPPLYPSQPLLPLRSQPPCPRPLLIISLTTFTPLTPLTMSIPTITPPDQMMYSCPLSTLSLQIKNLVNLQLQKMMCESDLHLSFVLLLRTPHRSQSSPSCLFPFLSLTEFLSLFIPSSPTLTGSLPLSPTHSPSSGLSSYHLSKSSPKPRKLLAALNGHRPRSRLSLGEEVDEIQTHHRMHTNWLICKHGLFLFTHQRFR